MRGLKQPSQRINLLQKPIVEAPNDPLGLISYLVVFVLGLSVVLGSYWYTGWRITTAKAEIAAADREIAQMRKQLAQYKDSETDEGPDPVLLASLQRLEASQAQVTEAIGMIREYRNASADGFSAVLRGLAKQPVEGLWLTQIRISGNDDTLSLKGKTLQADLVPQLIAKLGQEPVFRGRSFGNLRFERASAGVLNFDVLSKRMEGGRDGR